MAEPLELFLSCYFFLLWCPRIRQSSTRKTTSSFMERENQYTLEPKDQRPDHLALALTVAISHA